MTDTLRTRIAAVQSQHRSYGNDCECGWVDETGLYKQFTGHEQHVADAVIAELGLRMDTTCHIHDREGKQRCHRYVTEWETEVDQ